MNRKKTKKIAITGGKGGTGKSTFSVLLANKLLSKGKKVVLIDADIECPNDYLLLGVKLKNSVKDIKAQFPQLNKEPCTKCGKCVSQCRSNAIFQAPGKYPIFIRELCSGCGLCWHICPENVIEVEKVVIGKTYVNKINSDFTLVTGRSVGVVDETGPIVTSVREYVEKNLDADIILIDTSVGLHCGVIRALINTDLVYAVTEPTPLGKHDLQLILELINKLDLKKKVVVNQADLGDQTLIDPLIKKYQTEISYKIPYSKKLVGMYSQGKLGDLNFL